MEQKYVIALDQGTTSCRALIFDEQGRIVAQAGRSSDRFIPSPDGLNMILKKYGNVSWMYSIRP